MAVSDIIHFHPDELNIPTKQNGGQHNEEAVYNMPMWTSVRIVSPCPTVDAPPCA